MLLLVIALLNKRLWSSFSSLHRFYVNIAHLHPVDLQFIVLRFKDSKVFILTTKVFKIKTYVSVSFNCTKLRVGERIDL
jgi:hypothetical protein